MLKSDAKVDLGTKAIESKFYASLAEYKKNDTKANKKVMHDDMLTLIRCIKGEYKRKTITLEEYEELSQGYVAEYNKAIEE